MNKGSPLLVSVPVMGPTEAREEANSFQVGQVVKVKVPLNVLRMIQEGHGGYTPKMSEVRD